MNHTYGVTPFVPASPSSTFTIPHNITDSAGAAARPSWVNVSICSGNDNGAGQACALQVNWSWDATNIIVVTGQPVAGATVVWEARS